jgi:hypothetical protein
MSQSRFQLLAPADQDSTSSEYVGSGDYVVTIPERGSALSPSGRQQCKIKFLASKSSGTINAASDYIRIQSSHDGTNWVNEFAKYDDANPGNLLEGQTADSAAKGVQYLAIPGERIRIRASGVVLEFIVIQFA